MGRARGDRDEEWAVADPAGFRLIYGGPVPGYQEPPDAPGKAAELRACTALTDLVALESYGHLHPLIRDPATIYRDEMRALVTSLGLHAWLRTDRCEPRAPGLACGGWTISRVPGRRS
ncbi:TetR-like C-terminal domain-containing protein [Actinomadura logoneensis]|uniref:TetR-like C-terminal domain-containing protein n=1 Tax=Actinomadura logoneensis TaxID=2293572 RepID=UPI0018F22E5F|nr:WHG domain-containing protein [Actinomadura logoneensis]